MIGHQPQWPLLAGLRADPFFFNLTGWGWLHLLLGLDWRAAFLWGAVLSSTDAAANCSSDTGKEWRTSLARWVSF